MGVGTKPQVEGFDGSGRPEDWEAWTGEMDEDGVLKSVPPDTDVRELGRRILAPGGLGAFDARLGTPMVALRPRQLPKFIVDPLISGREFPPPTAA